MRVNVYNEELSDDVKVVRTDVPARAGSGEIDHTYYGVRIFLESSDKLHHTFNDDDRSAITFWFGDYEMCQFAANQWIEVLALYFKRELMVIDEVSEDG